MNEEDQPAVETGDVEGDVNIETGGGDSAESSEGQSSEGQEAGDSTEGQGQE